MGGSDSAANGAPHKNSTNTHIYSIDHHRNTMGRNEEHQRHRTRKDYGQRPDDVLGGEAAWALKGGAGQGALTISSFDLTVDKHFSPKVQLWLPRFLLLALFTLGVYQILLYANYHQWPCKHPFPNWLLMNGLIWLILLTAYVSKSSSEFLAQSCHGCYLLVTLFLNVLGSVWLHDIVGFLPAGDPHSVIDSASCPDIIIVSMWYILAGQWLLYIALWTATFIFIYIGIRDSDPYTEDFEAQAVAKLMGTERP